MTRSSPTEAALDNALAEALLDSQGHFASWLLSRTRFASEGARCVEVRADNPWSRVALPVHDPATGHIEQFIRDCETDVLAIFATAGSRRFALHLENKLAGGKFTHLQPESYRERLIQWRLKPRLGMYEDASSVLIAPQAFYERNRVAAAMFEAFVSHEAIAEHVPLFGRRDGCAE